MAIKILRQGMPVVGYAKIGESGGQTQDGRQRPPVKFDHIELTGLERDANGKRVPDVQLMARLLEQGGDAIPTCGGCARSEALAKSTGIKLFERGLPRRLPIVLPYDDIEVNLPNRLALYRNKTAFCTGDGETAMRLEERDPITRGGKQIPQFGPARPWSPCGPSCVDFQNRRCKPHGKLRFVLATQENVGGCFEYVTTSWNSLANLQASLELIAGLTAGRLAWVPLLFEVSPQTVQAADGSAPATTAYIARVTFPGKPTALLETVRENLALRAPLMAEIRQLEARARADVQWNDSPEEIGAFTEEFVPDVAQEPAAEVVTATPIEVAARDAEPEDETAAEEDPFDAPPTKRAGKAEAETTETAPPAQSDWMEKF